MSWVLLGLLCVSLVFFLAWVSVGRVERSRVRRVLGDRADARARGSDRARLQYPQIDLARCLGCATCVAACPEEGVLDVLHGQAVVIHGARCVGHGRCAEECPTGAIAVALGDMDTRTDIPALKPSFETTTVPGLFLAGEVTGFALVRTALAHGMAVAREVAQRPRPDGLADEVLDLVVVGAGPAGLSCALEAHARGLRTLVLEQETLGGTVSSYPRRKLVMTHPIALPGGRSLTKRSYQKEELVEIWESIVREAGLPLRTSVHFEGARRRGDGIFEVACEGERLLARHVCLALGRRGTPRKLDVPGEELPKVAYSLLDAASYAERRILVVGGGDSAVEAALGLAEQPGTDVTISYRRAAFFRLKARNEARMNAALESGAVRGLFESEVLRIEPDAVELRTKDERAPNGSTLSLPNDDVFVLAGGIPPFQRLEDCGVSFAPEDRDAVLMDERKPSGLFGALVFALVVLTLAVGWLVARADYYAAPFADRPASSLHGVLKPSGTVGLVFGCVALALLLANLSYLLRRAPRVPFRVGSLRTWMTSHVATGLLTLVFALLHAAMDPRDTVGGHALFGLAILALTGAIGRYFYSFVPRAANGRELELEEVQAELARLASGFDRENRAFGERVRATLAEIVPDARWSASLPRRIALVARSQWRSRRALGELRRIGVEEGIPADQLESALALATRAQSASLGATHFSELRGLLGAWRYFHRWVALLICLLIAVHVAVALRYGGLLS